MVQSKLSSAGVDRPAQPALQLARAHVSVCMRAGDDVKDELTRRPPAVAGIWLQVRAAALAPGLGVCTCARIRLCAAASFRVTAAVTLMVYS